MLRKILALLGLVSTPAPAAPVPQARVIVTQNGIELRTSGIKRVRVRINREVTKTPRIVPVPVIMTVPVERRIFIAPPPASPAATPSNDGEDRAYAILKKLDGLEHLIRDLQRPPDDDLNEEAVAVPLPQREVRGKRRTIPGPAFYSGRVCETCYSHVWQPQDVRCPTCDAPPPWMAARQ